jgi:hypothetical protein
MLNTGSKVKTKRFFAWAKRYRGFDSNWSAHAVIGEFIFRLQGVWHDIVDPSSKEVAPPKARTTHMCPGGAAASHRAISANDRQHAAK